MINREDNSFSCVPKLDAALFEAKTELLTTLHVYSKDFVEECCKNQGVPTIDGLEKLYDHLISKTKETFFQLVHESLNSVSEKEIIALKKAYTSRRG